MGRRRSRTSPERPRGRGHGYEEFEEEDEEEEETPKKKKRKGGMKRGKTGPEEEEEFTGPAKHRGCTDILCLLLFAAFVIFMIYLLIYGLVYGNAYRLTHGYDVSGNICGRKNGPIAGVAFSGLNMTGNPYLYFDLAKTAKILAGQVFTSVVQNIANASGVNVTSNNTAAISSFFAGTNTSYCLNFSSAVNGTKAKLVKDSSILLLNDSSSSSSNSSEGKFSTAKQLTESQALTFLAKDLELDPVSLVVTGGGSCRYCVNKCPSNTQAYLSRCIPLASILNDTSNAFYSGSGIQDFLSHAIADIRLSWRQIIYMALIALGFSIIMTFLLRFLAGVIVYVVMILCMLACIGGTIFLWVIYGYKRKSYNNAKNNNQTMSVDQNDYQDTSATERLMQSSSQTDVNNFLGAAICATIVTVIILLILLVLRKRIQLVIQLFSEAGSAVHSMPILLIQPLWTLLAMVVALSLWTLGLLMLESAGKPTPNSATGFITYEKTPFLLAMRWFYLFGLFWVAQFIIACQHLVIAGAVATWYFAKDKSHLGWPVLQGHWLLVRYHLGSVAFGSFIIALIQFIRVIMHFLERRLKNANPNNPVCAAAKPFLICCVKCCECCVWCFEKVIKFISKNAYIEIAIHGFGFCAAARKAFSTLTANALRVAALNSVGSFVLFLAKVVIVVATAVAGAAIINDMSPDADGRKVLYMWVPVTLGAIFAYIIADAFIEVYGMAIDTIFLCFCEDCEINDGHSKPYFMSKGLMNYVSNSNHAMRAEKQDKN